MTTNQFSPAGIVIGVVLSIAIGVGATAVDHDESRHEAEKPVWLRQVEDDAKCQIWRVTSDVYDLGYKYFAYCDPGVLELHEVTDL